MASVINALFRLSVMTWKINGVGIEDSDLASSCGGTFFNVQVSVEYFLKNYYHNDV